MIILITEIVLVVALLIVGGIAFNLGRMITRLRDDLSTERSARISLCAQLCENIQRIEKFLDQWVPRAEHGQPRQHIHWFTDRWAGLGPVGECRCGEKEELQ